jgi:hypothetical protein
MPLTDVKIKAAKPTAKAYRISDAHSMYLWVTPAGGKLWRWAYRYAGKEKLMSFGQYPDVSLADARERHAAARKLLAAGVDPMAQRKAEKIAGNTDSFQAIAELWLNHWQPEKSAQHVDATRRRLCFNVYPCIGARPIAVIEAPEIVRMVKIIEARGGWGSSKESTADYRANLPVRDRPRLRQAQSGC